MDRKPQSRDQDKPLKLRKPSRSHRSRSRDKDKPHKSRDKPRKPHRNKSHEKPVREEKKIAHKWADPRNNPHVFQVLSNSNYSMQEIPFTRELKEDAPRERYRRRKNEPKTVIHWGQRKLLLSEVEFLTLFGSCENPVVYAGAAPGTHLNDLAEMFPQHTFHCYDPAPFNVKQLPNLHTYQVLFTDELALAYRTRDVLFISDIRAAQHCTEEVNDVEEAIGTDMDDQQRWFALMQPVAAMLKFRLSWKPGTTQYMDGKILLPVFGPITTTESRLVVVGKAAAALPNHRLARERAARAKESPAADDTNEQQQAAESVFESKTAVVLRGDSGFLMQIRDYNNTAYEEQMFYFNTRQRVALYPHRAKGEGLDHCYDCRAEVHILQAYCEQVMGMPTGTKEERARVMDCVEAMSKRISHALTGGKRTLLDGNSDPLQRNTGIRDTQWICGKPAYKEAHEIRARDRVSGKLPQLIAGGCENTSSSSTSSSLLAGPFFQDSGGLVPMQKVSGTTISHPLVNHMRMLLQRETTTFKLPEGTIFRQRQAKPSATGWARCVTEDGFVVYVNEARKICTKDPPAIAGWVVRARTSESSSGNYWENTLTGKISIDVPQPLVDF